MTPARGRRQTKVSLEHELELRLTRLIDAPRRRVYRAWTEPEHLARWWGPHGFTNPVCDVDPRPGGILRIVMRAPDGDEYPCSGHFLEVVEPERLVFAEDTAGHPAAWQEMLDHYRGTGVTGEPLRQVTTVTFEDRGGETLLTVVNRFPSVTDRDAVCKMGAAEGWSQSLERLEELLGAS